MTDAEAVQLLASMECCECKLWKDHCPVCEVSCPDCKDASGKSTGRRFPGLSRECPCNPYTWTNHGCEMDCIPGRHAFECDCQGFGQVLVSIPEAVYWLMGQREFEGITPLWVHRQRIYKVSWSNHVETGPTIPQAFARAIAAEGE